MNNLKLSMYEEVPLSKAKRLLDSRALGFSQLRLLPKANGFRPITNLRRRSTKLQNGKVTLGRSINSVMSPVFNMLDLEKRTRPMFMGNALSSVGDVYSKLQNFRDKLPTSRAQPLLFAKADVKSCFDTIPQQAVVSLMAQIAADDVYRIARHSEIKYTKLEHYRKSAHQQIAKTARKFVSTARRATDFADFDEWLIESHMAEKQQTVFTDNVVQQHYQREKLMDLLKQHVQGNIIKVGKKYFRQKSGIPQGSILSSLLCSFFYTELEVKHFQFLDDSESLLVRLIDDFLLITTNETHAMRFMQIMHDGIGSYGVEVNPSKTLVNFELKINGQRVPKCSSSKSFPYCGNMIDTNTLEITKDRQRRKATTLGDTLTVEEAKTPGRIFYRKALNAFKIQCHSMLLDTNFNSANTVLSTVYQNLLEVAMKYFRYCKSMAASARPHLDLLTGKNATHLKSCSDP